MFRWGVSDGSYLSLGIHKHNVVIILPMCTRTNTHTYHQTHRAPPLPLAAYLDNYLPQVPVHRDTPCTCCHRGHCAKESRRQPFRGQRGEKRGGGVMMMMCVCVYVCGWWGWWICGGVRKHQGELASMRQASWQAYGLLITQGLPQPLGAVSNMRERNQPLQNRSPLQSLCV